MAALGLFVPAQEEETPWNSRADLKPSPPTSSLSGEEARRFYESLTEEGDREERSRPCKRIADKRQNHRGRRDGEGGLAESSRGNGRSSGRRLQTGGNTTVQRAGREVEGRHQRPAGTRDPGATRTTELQGLKLLRSAQEGNLSGMKELLSSGVNINFQDPFFWTAMMCASWAGQRAAVRLLLQHGAAWVGVVDLQGRDARELALTAGHQGVVEELDNYGRDTGGDTQPNHSVHQPQWCDVCGNQYSSSLSSHLTSTLHQFNLRRPTPTPQYCLPSSSTSYQMMVRSGWDPGAGLGPEGSGPKQPVPTVLKRDQKGLGYGPAKRARVTHFQAKDPQAVKRPPKGGEGWGDKKKRKEDSRGKEKRDKNWERDFRTSFYL